jgi:hypothetical protein
MNPITKANAHLFKHSKTTTAKEYQDASTEEDSPAGVFIDAGLEPYIVDMDAYVMGLHAFVEVWDVTFPQYGLTLTTQYGEIEVSDDTILVWR